MKIDRLYTLSHFVDITTSHNEGEWTCKRLIEDAEKIQCYVGSEIATKIHDYNNFLKQPLTKDMFVNPIVKPSYCEDAVSDGALMNEWQEAEKKVIFKGFNKSQYYSFNYHNGLFRIDFSNCDFIKYGSMFNQELILVKTLSDLAEATNGELEINLEI